MANSKSAKKRVKVAAAKTLQNTIVRSSLKTSIRKFNETVASNVDVAGDILKKTFKLIDKAVAKNILHKNTGSRRKSKLTRMLNTATKVAK